MTVSDPAGTPRARAIAFYLPQFHPIAENDQWWGPGFTEWTNVAKARPLFPGHHQPNLPADLGFYDLRLADTRERQAEFARAAGIEAFCYWHYWFGGERLLEQPLEEVLASGRPDHSFMVGWANQTWSGVWHGAPDRVLMEQTYPGMADHDRHFATLERFFHDPRYFRIDGVPVLYVYAPSQIPDWPRVAERWRQRADDSGLGGLYLIGERRDGVEPPAPALDASVRVLLHLEEQDPRWVRWVRRALPGPALYDYRKRWSQIVPDTVRRDDEHAVVVPNWDNTPRSGRRGRVFYGSSPDIFRRQLRLALSQIAAKPAQHRLLFVKSWNEWAEGNYVEPDQRFGHGWLRALADELRP